MVRESYWHTGWVCGGSQILLAHWVGFVMVHESYWMDLLWFMNLTGWVCHGSLILLGECVMVHESYWLGLSWFTSLAGWVCHGS